MDRGATLYAQYLAGDEDALAALIDLFYDALTLYLYHFTGSLAAAEDLAEDTFVKLAVKKPAFRGQAAFRTWLFAIGRNLALDFLRQNKHRAPVQDSADEAYIEQEFIRQEDKILLHRAMQNIKPVYRQVLWLTYFADCPPGQIALLLHRSTSAADHLLARAKAALKKELQQEDFLL